MDKILVTRSSMPSLDEYIGEIKNIWESHHLTNMGPKHNQLLAELKEYLDVPNIELFTNGHMALELCIQAFGFKKGGEVITTPFTFSSTTHAIVRNGLKPVFCDINKDYYTIDVSKIERLITNNTVAIIPVHVYGNICNVEEIDKISKRYNLKVIYDAAHAFGEKYNERGIGNFGDASMFSFHATKVFNTIEGGAIAFNDDKLQKTLYNLKNFGIKNEEEVVYVGSNAKMNEFCAAMGLCNLRHLTEEINKRKLVTERYFERLNNLKGIKLNYVQSEVTPNYAYFPIVVNPEDFGVDRNAIFEELKKNNIYSRKYFYPLITDYECYRDKYDSNDTPVAKQISMDVLTLPIYADLQLNEVDRICDIITSLKR